MKYVSQGPDEADKWIVGAAGQGISSSQMIFFWPRALKEGAYGVRTVRAAAENRQPAGQPRFDGRFTGSPASGYGQSRWQRALRLMCRFKRVLTKGKATHRVKDTADRITRPGGQLCSYGAIYRKSAIAEFSCFMSLDIRPVIHNTQARACGHINTALLVNSAELVFIAALINRGDRIRAVWPDQCHFIEI